MKILYRQDIVGKKIVDVLQTEINEINDFSDRTIFLTLHDGTCFALASQDPEISPPLVLSQIDIGSLVPLKESDVAEHCHNRTIREVCYAYFSPAIFILLDGNMFLWIACDEYGLYVDLSPIDSEDFDLEKAFTFWGQKKLDLAEFEKNN